MEMIWEDGFSIAVKVENDAVTISANKEGLLSLAQPLESIGTGQYTRCTLPPR